jgi:hypothetical protein
MGFKLHQTEDDDEDDGGKKRCEDIMYNVEEACQ